MHVKIIIYINTQIIYNNMYSFNDDYICIVLYEYIYKCINNI